MKNKFGVLGPLAVSMLVYTCTTSRHTEQVDSPYPKRMFNPQPSAEYLSPEESLKSFNLPEGYRMELVASEPMIKEPVAIAWDGNAKMYVAEMLTYMQDAEATGEQLPLSRISLLEDTDNDGRMDKSSVFIDSLLLPRMILCVNHELLVNETNTITISAYKDTDGDGEADKKRIVYQDPKFATNRNMEHQRSGLDWNLDNWIYMTYESIRFRYTNGVLKADSIISGSAGQWGLTHDNYGRLFYSAAGSEAPIYRFQINPVYGALDFKDQYTEEFATVWPIISTPDVQGGLPRLRPDSSLNRFTGCNGQSIYRGDKLPEDMVGDYILCEPVGRLIRRAKLINIKGKTVARNAYYRQEFIASSDMNFRPVNSYTGPDGYLYIVDMHRGIIQQGNWTRPGSFLRGVIDRWGFSKNIGHGRIYRVVHDEYKPGKVPDMLNETPSQLVTHLDHPNGWWRDNAQKQLVILNDQSVVPALKQIVRGEQATLSAKPSHLGRLHALWTLEGLNAIDKELLFTALKDENEQVRRAAIWISEPFIKKNNTEIMQKLSGLISDRSHDVRVQLLLSLSYNKGDQAQSIVTRLLAQNEDNDIFAGITGSLERTQNIKAYGTRVGTLGVENRNLVLEGASIFRSLCSSCHGSDAKGLPGAIAPPLVGSKRLAGDKVTAIRIMLHGLSGPIDGKTYPGDLMPSMGANSDRWIASVLSYARFEFGNIPRSGPSPFITAEEVKTVREQSGARSTAWTVAELEAVNRSKSK